MFRKAIYNFLMQDGGGTGAGTDAAAGSDAQLDNLTQEQLEQRYLNDEHDRQEDDAAKGGEGKAKPQPGSGKIIEIKRDDKTGETIIIREEELTAEEQLQAAADAAKAAEAAQKAAAAGTVDQAKLDAALAELETQYAALAAKHPELAKLIPQGQGIRGVVTKFNELSTRIQEVEQRENTAADAERRAQELRTQEQVQKFVGEEAMRRLAAQASALEIDMKTVPTTKEAWRKLWDVDPYTARTIERALEENERTVLREVIDVRRAQEQAPTYNARQIDDAFPAIEKIAKDASLTVTADEFVEWAKKHVGDPAAGKPGNPALFEVRAGSYFLRDKALVAQWSLEHQAQLISAAKAASGEAARRQTVGSLTNNGPSTVVLGATGSGQARRQRETRIKPGDERALDGLSIEELQALYDKG